MIQTHMEKKIKSSLQNTIRDITNWGLKLKKIKFITYMKLDKIPERKNKTLREREKR